MIYDGYLYLNTCFCIDFPLVFYGLEVGDSVLFMDNRGRTEEILHSVPFLGITKTNIYIRNSRNVTAYFLNLTK